MGFPLLKLPNELIFKTITHITNPKDLRNLLKVKEIKDLVAQDLRIVSDDDELEFFEEISQGIQRLKVSQTKRLISKDLIYLVDFEVCGSFFTNDFPELPLDHFKNTNTFVYANLRGASTFESSFNHYYGYFKRLNICATLLYDRRGEIVGPLETNNIHPQVYAFITTGITEIKPGARIDLDPGLNASMFFGHNTDFYKRYDPKTFETACILKFGDDAEELMDVWDYEKEEVAEKRQFPLKHKPFTLTDASFPAPELYISTCSYLDRLQLGAEGREGYYFEQEIGVWLVTAPPEDGSVPVIGDVEIGSKMLCLRSFGKFPALTGVKAPKLEELRLYCHSMEGVDFYECFREGFDKLVSTDFLKNVKKLEIRGDLGILAYIHQSLGPLEEVKFVINSQSQKSVSCELSAKKFDFVVIEGTIPKLNAPSVEKIIIQTPKKYEANLDGIRHYPNIKELKVRCHEDTYARFNGWPKMLSLNNLETLSVHSKAFDLGDIFPDIELPKLKNLIVEGNDCHCFERKLSIKAPKLKTIRMPGEEMYYEYDDWYEPEVDDEDRSIDLYETHVELMIQGFHHLRSVQVRGVHEVVIDDCPELVELSVHGPETESIIFDLPIPKKFAKLEYFDPEANIHHIPGWRGRPGPVKLGAE